MTSPGSILFRCAAIAISLLVLAPPVAVAKEKKGGKKAPKSLHTYLRRHSAGMPLEKDFRGTQYIANGSVNGVDATFLLDTGAPSSTLELASVKKFKLKMRKIDEKTMGIGGEGDTYVVKLKDFKLGPHIQIGNQEIQAIASEQTEGQAHDGLIGGDILNGMKGVIDFSTDRLCYPRNGKAIDLAGQAGKFKVASVALEGADEGHHIIRCKINGHPARMVLDTGAQQTVIDASFAEKCAIKAYDTPVVVAGVGDEQKSTMIASVSELAVGGFTLKRFPALVMDLGHVNDGGKDFDGILGAEILHASGCIYDVGEGNLYFDSGTFETGDISMLPGEFPMDNDALRKKIADTELVVECKMVGLALTDAKAVIDGKEYTMAMFTVNIERLIKADDDGPFKKGVEVQFSVLVPQRPDLAEFLQFFAAKNPQKVLFFNPSLKDRPIEEYPVFDDAVFTAGVLRTRHLERVMGGESQKGGEMDFDE